MINVKIQGADLRGLAQMFPKAAVRALSKVGRTIEVQANRALREIYTVGRIDVDKKISARPASVTRLEHRIKFEGGQTPIVQMSARENRGTQAFKVAKKIEKVGRGKKISRFVKVTRGKADQATGTTVEIKKGDPKLAPHWFIAKMKSGHVGVFVREATKRLKIHERFTLSIAQMIGQMKISKPLQDTATKKLPQVLAHELDYEMKQVKRDIVS